MSFAADARRYRFSSRYALVLADRLPPGDRARFAPLLRDPNVYGALIPAAGGAAFSASREVALLLLTLREPGPLPAYLHAGEDPQVARTIEKLVLDGVLEVERDGAWLSGPGALEAVAVEAPRGRIGALSEAALAHLERVDVDGDSDGEARLYFYNRAPMTPAWSARLPGRRAVRDFLGADRGNVAALLNRTWPSETTGGQEVWLRWGSLRDVEELHAPARPTFKVYASAPLAVLPEAFARTVEVFAEARVRVFKIGATAHGLSRADKCVAYFHTRERAVECATMLAGALRDIPAQGVPFTAAVGDEGIVSWGVDPPAAPGGSRDASWRRWVCRRLAKYLLAAKREAAAPSPARFALERLRLDGVNTATWEPRPELVT